MIILYLGYHEVFIRIQNNLLDICPIRINSFGASTAYEPVLRVQVKEVLEHSFEGVVDNVDKLQIDITGNFINETRKTFSQLFIYHI